MPVGVGVYDLIYWYTDFYELFRHGTHVVTVQEIPVVYAGPDTSFCSNQFRTSWV